MKPSERNEVVDTLRVQWHLLWRDRIVDRVNSEGIANRDYATLFVEQGTVITANRDYKPPDFGEILHRHVSSDAKKEGPPNPHVGGWGKFIRTAIQKRRPLPQRRGPPKIKPPKSRQIKKNGRGWLHLSRK